VWFDRGEEEEKGEKKKKKTIESGVGKTKQQTRFEWEDLKGEGEDELVTQQQQQLLVI
jgi:hypothetical protein